MNIYKTAALLFVLIALTPDATNAELLAHYSFEGTSDTLAVDVSGKGHDGRINSALRTDGYRGNALEFFGTENVVLPGEDMGMNAFEGSLTMWMKIADDDVDKIYTIFWGGDNETGGGFGPENEFHVVLEPTEVSWAGGELSCTVTGNSDTQLAFLYSDPEKGRNPATPPVNPTLLNDGQWHHIAIVWDGTSATIEMYIDGSLIDMQDDYEGDDYPFTHIFLGKMANGTRTLIGLLDEVRLYSDALSAAEVLAIFDGSVTTVDEQQLSIADDFVLFQNYPNPFNPQTTISVSLAQSATVKLTVYDISGRAAREFSTKDYQAGIHNIVFDGSALASGIYFIHATIRFSGFEKIVSKKMVLLK